MVSKHIMNLTVVIILCALIALALILFPLIMSHKAEKTAKKNEWRKIQGRFEEITFVESIEQTIRIISRAIIQTFSKSQTADLKRVIKQPVQGVLDSKIFPNLLKIRESVEFFHAAYPLHPVTAILLPILAQKLGQNERTVFIFKKRSIYFM